MMKKLKVPTKTLKQIKSRSATIVMGDLNKVDQGKVENCAGNLGMGTHND